MSLMRDLIDGRYWRYRGEHGKFLRYGYPAYGEAEPNVMAQWLFEEDGSVGHTNAVDQVGGYVLTPVGSPIYGIPATGRFKKLAPGISMTELDGLKTDTPDASIAPGTGSFTREFWVTLAPGGSIYNIFSSVDFDDPQLKGEYYWYSIGIGTTRTMFCGLTDSTGTYQFAPWIAVSDIADGGLHKIRIEADRVGGGLSRFTIEIDDTPQNNPNNLYDMSDLDGRSIPMPKIQLGACGITNEYPGTQAFFEARFSNNATNNSTK